MRERVSEMCGDICALSNQYLEDKAAEEVPADVDYIKQRAADAMGSVYQDDKFSDVASEVAKDTIDWLISARFFSARPPITVEQLEAMKINMGGMMPASTRHRWKAEGRNEALDEIINLIKKGGGE